MRFHANKCEDIAKLHQKMIGSLDIFIPNNPCSHLRQRIMKDNLQDRVHNFLHLPLNKSEGTCTKDLSDLELRVNSATLT